MGDGGRENCLQASADVYRCQELPFSWKERIDGDGGAREGGIVGSHEPAPYPLFVFRRRGVGAGSLNPTQEDPKRRQATPGHSQDPASLRPGVFALKVVCLVGGRSPRAARTASLAMTFSKGNKIGKIPRSTS